MTIGEFILKISQKQEPDLTKYSESFIQKVFTERRTNHNPKISNEAYLEYLNQNPSEFSIFFRHLFPNVSNFYRDRLTWEYLAKILFPQVIQNMLDNPTSSLRIWSAGCARGEEPYTTAIIIKHYLETLNIKIRSYILGTDLSNYNLTQARKGLYHIESIKEVTLKILNRYFSKVQDHYKINPEILDMVKFSNYDLLEEKSFAPQDSIFAGFNVIFCRNVLYYFKSEAVNNILTKFYKSLVPGGILVLGNAELLPEDFEHLFHRINPIVPVYKKSTAVYKRSHRNV